MDVHVLKPSALETGGERMKLMRINTMFACIHGSKSESKRELSLCPSRLEF